MLTSEYFSQYIRHARVNDAQIFLLNIRFWNQVILVGKRTFFDVYIQIRYSTWYWEQPSKLGPVHNTMMWSVVGNAMKK